MDSLFTLLYEMVGKKEFQEGLVDLLYVTAKNKEEAYGNPFVKIPNSVTSIRFGAFSNCSSITSVNIPNSVNYIDLFAFTKCISLTFINIPNSLKNIDEYAFVECSNIKNIQIPIKFKPIMKKIFAGVDLSKVKITYT